MSVDVAEADEEELERWDDWIERSPQGCVFHRRPALSAQERHSGARLRPLVGYKGEEPVGVFPVFELRKGPVPTAFSPPPGIRVSYLGPAYLNLGKLKPRTAERRRRRFIEGCLEWIDEEIGPWYAHVRTSADFEDARPFAWDGCDVTPNYTYLVDLARDEEAVLASFSRDARSNVTGDHEERHAIEVGGRDAVVAIVEQVRRRYESQGVTFGVPTAFVVDLYENLPDGQLRPYVLRVDGALVGGIIALADGDTISRWLGGVRTGADVDLPVNDLLDWRVMADGIAEGLQWYDLVGADNPRINRYKSKFAPELRSFYRVERGRPSVRRAAHLYERFK